MCLMPRTNKCHVRICRPCCGNPPYGAHLCTKGHWCLAARAAFRDVLYGQSLARAHCATDTVAAGMRAGRPGAVAVDGSTAFGAKCISNQSPPSTLPPCSMLLSGFFYHAGIIPSYLPPPPPINLH